MCRHYPPIAISLVNAMIVREEQREVAPNIECFRRPDEGGSNSQAASIGSDTQVDDTHDLIELPGYCDYAKVKSGMADKAILFERKKPMMGLLFVKGATIERFGETVVQQIDQSRSDVLSACHANGNIRRKVIAIILKFHISLIAR